MAQTKVEVQGGEIALRNSHGDIVIIPRGKVAHIKSLIKSGCNECVDGEVSRLPKAASIAQDGSVIQNQPDPENKNPFFRMINAVKDSDIYKETKKTTEGVIQDVKDFDFDKWVNTPDETRNFDIASTDEVYNQAKARRLHKRTLQGKPTSIADGNNYKNVAGESFDEDGEYLSMTTNLPEVVINANESGEAMINYFEPDRLLTGVEGFEESDDIDPAKFSIGANKVGTIKGGRKQFTEKPENASDAVGPQCTKFVCDELINKYDIKIDKPTSTTGDAWERMEHMPDQYRKVWSIFNENNRMPSITSLEETEFMVQTELDLGERHPDTGRKLRKFERKKLQESYDVKMGARSRRGKVIDTLMETAVDPKDPARREILESLSPTSVVNIYNPGSSFSNEAWDDTRDQTPGSHFGYIVEDAQGKKFVMHKYGGIKRTPLEQLITGKNKNGLIIHAASNNDDFSKEIKMSQYTSMMNNVEGIKNSDSALLTTDMNVMTGYAKHYSAQLANAEGIDLSYKNQQELMRASVLIINQESGGGTLKYYKWVRDLLGPVADMREAFGGEEASAGPSRTKPRTNFSKEQRDYYGINKSNLKDIGHLGAKTAVKAVQLKLLDSYSRLAKIQKNDKEVKLTNNELWKLAIFSHNTGNVPNSLRKYKTYEGVIGAYEKEAKEGNKKFSLYNPVTNFDIIKFD